jgi:hypothetical protein
MAVDSHVKARLLLDRSLVEGIAPEDRPWLEAHLGECDECSRYADVSTRAVRALDWFALEIDPVAALRTQTVVCRRADEMRSAEARARTLWIGTAVALCLTFAGSALVWSPVARLAGEWNVPNSAWQAGFAAFWWLPSLLLAVLPLFRSRLLADDADRRRQTV